MGSYSGFVQCGLYSVGCVKEQTNSCDDNEDDDEALINFILKYSLSSHTDYSQLLLIC